MTHKPVYRPSTQSIVFMVATGIIAWAILDTVIGSLL